MLVGAGCSSVPAVQPAPTPLPAVPDLSGVTAEGRLEPIRFTTLALNAEGLVDEVLVSEGDFVDAGDLLVRLSNPDARSLEEARSNAALELSGANDAVRSAQEKFDDYPVPRVFVGLTPEQAAQVWLHNLDSARLAFEPYEGTSRKSLKPNHHIFPSLPRRIWFDTNEYHGMAKETKKAVEVGWMNYRKAVDWLALGSALEAAKARLLQAQSDYDNLQDASLSENTAGARAALATSQLRAPFAGAIAAMKIKSGEHASVGEPLVTIGDLSNWVVKTTDLTEIDVISVKEGQPVTVTLDAIPNRVFDGRVSHIAQEYSERQGDIVYTATILIAQHDPGMRWGMTAQVNFSQ
jgi:multidrug resistance efflux pump